MQISSVTALVDQSLCFFASPIENIHALIEKSPKDLNPELKDYMDTSWRIWTMNSKITFPRDAAHIIDLHLNILTPVPDISTLKLMKYTCNLLEPFEL